MKFADGGRPVIGAGREGSLSVPSVLSARKIMT